MIGRLEGRLRRVDPGTVLIEAGGVGYLVATTLRAYQELAGRKESALWIHTQVRSDAIVLFGFPDREELEAFEKLIAVAGIGPRTALGVLSAMTASELAQTVEDGDLARLQRSPGVGRKTAERILLELKGRLPMGGAEEDHRTRDAISALVNLGYSQRDAQRAVNDVWAEASGDDLGEVLRRALQKLTR
ncbi:MAG: Holliday junction branch migration protein RuvA [Acidobacteriota bacterium]|jgi:Holliday junction DNA helicase RuvA